MDRIDVEFRSVALEGNTLSGVAHVFGKRALVGGRYEEMAATAFDRVLKDPATDARAFFNHDTNMLLGRQGAGTLRIDVGDGVLAFSVDLPETSYAADLKALVARGDLSGASFGFLPGQFNLSRATDGREVRTHTEVRALMDVSPVSLPAFDGTALELRSVQDAESLGSQLVRARQAARARQAPVPPIPTGVVLFSTVVYDSAGRIDHAVQHLDTGETRKQRVERDQAGRAVRLVLDN